MPSVDNCMHRAEVLIGKTLDPEHYKLVPIVTECDACKRRAYIRGPVCGVQQLDLCCDCFSNLVLEA